MTSVSEERDRQRRWRLRPRWAKLTDFDRLIENEFLPADEQRAHEARVLSRFVRFAASQVPYYNELFAGPGLTGRDIRCREDLPRLPILTKRIIADQGMRLMPRALPPGERHAGGNFPSGTTGAPVPMFRTARNRAIEAVLMQRQLRWFRFDPAGTLASIRVAGNLRGRPDGKPLPEGETLRRPHWPGVGEYFETGPFIGFAISNPMDRKVCWLEEHRPDYLRAASCQFEQLALAFQGRPRLESLRGMRATAEPLTPGMQDRIEAVFGVPVHMSFGSNELGWIATRCPEGGRYHVHTENCLVEIVDEEGNATAPGDFGRVLVTVVSNLAMPLIRCDMDDVAQALDDSPCPCGRTLPTFGPIVGRYSRIAALPPGTLDLVNALRDAIERLPPSLTRNLRKYRVHQSRTAGFELRLVLAGPLAAGFETHVRKAWDAVAAPAGRAPGAGPSLGIVEVDDIPLTPTGKFFHFTSDFISPPEPESAPGSAAESRAPGDAG